MVKFPALLADNKFAPRAFERHNRAAKPLVAQVTSFPQTAADSHPGQADCSRHYWRPPNPEIVVPTGKPTRNSCSTGSGRQRDPHPAGPDIELKEAQQAQENDCRDQASQ